jgi:hypothetical protein
MDLIVGHVNKGEFPTCVFPGNYNETILSNRSFAHIAGEDIQVLAVFLGKGPQASDVHQKLLELTPAKTIGWFKASPGQVVDAVHFFLAPTSMANTFARSVDQLIDLSPKKSHDKALCKQDGDSKPKPAARPRAKQEPSTTDAKSTSDAKPSTSESKLERKPRVRIRKEAQSDDSV